MNHPPSRLDTPLISKYGPPLGGGNPAVSHRPPSASIDAPMRLGLIWPPLKNRQSMPLFREWAVNTSHK